jgi:hypothetical protein
MQRICEIEKSNRPKFVSPLLYLQMQKIVEDSINFNFSVLVENHSFY